MYPFRKGDKAFIVDNRYYIRKVTVLRVMIDFYVIKYDEIGPVIRIKKSRLFPTENEAKLAKCQSVTLLSPIAFADLLSYNQFLIT